MADHAATVAFDRVRWLIFACLLFSPPVGCCQRTVFGLMANLEASETVAIEWRVAFDDRLRIEEIVHVESDFSWAEITYYGAE